MACEKHDTETVTKDYKKITIARTGLGYSGAADSLIIELNNDSTIKSIKTYTFGIGTVCAQTIKTFIYQPNSKLPDSSEIETKDWMGITGNFTEKYLYENGRIVHVYSPGIGEGENSSPVTYSYLYNQEGKVMNKISSYSYHQDTLHTNFKFEYIGENVSSSTNGSGDRNKYITFDDKINPLNELFRKCMFPINDEINGLFPPEYLFSENNPIKMKIQLNGIAIDQIYKYNQFNYPIEVISNWGYYNIRFYYE